MKILTPLETRTQHKEQCHVKMKDRISKNILK